MKPPSGEKLIGGETAPVKATGCNFTPLVLMIGLSVHSAFEGIAVGLISDEGDLWTFILAIGLHKWAAAVALGISIHKGFQDQTWLLFGMITIFSIATPIGIGLGMIIEGSSPILEIIFSALAGGTFLYIACTEVIVEEFSTQEWKYTKLICFLAGAALITGVGAIGG